MCSPVFEAMLKSDFKEGKSDKADDASDKADDTSEKADDASDKADDTSDKEDEEVEGEEEDYDSPLASVSYFDYDYDDVSEEDFNNAEEAALTTTPRPTSTWQSPTMAQPRIPPFRVPRANWESGDPLRSHHAGHHWP